AQQSGADVVTCINAFVHGDEATNLLQPLYLIPALAVVNMKLKDVWGFCAFIWVFWTVLAMLGFYFIPMFV
ncbi:MAG: TIGR00366 family protein, partial [Eubacteriales bacterium]